MISLLLLGSSDPAKALSGKQHVNLGGNCWTITELELSKIGYVTLKFERGHQWSVLCSTNKIYDVTTLPKGQIRGAKGVRGQTLDEVFYIQVTTETKVIYLKYQKVVKSKQSVEHKGYPIYPELKSLLTLLKAEQSSPTWQKAFKASERVNWRLKPKQIKHLPE